MPPTKNPLAFTGPSRSNHNAYAMTTRRQLAYQYLGVSPNAVLSAPKIAPFIASIPGSFEFVLKCLRASSEPNARLFLKYYDDPAMPLYVRAQLPVEAFCIVAGIDISQFMHTILVSVQIFGVTLGNLTAAINLPRVVQASVDEAVKPEGLADREMQLKHAGFLPMPKGSQVSVSVNATANAQQATIAPSPEDSIRRLQDQFSESRRSIHAAENTAAALLPEGATEVLPPLHERDLDAMAPVLRQDNNV